MGRKLLVVMPMTKNYLDPCDVDFAYSFQEAKEMILSAELCGQPYMDLDLPVQNEKLFWQFVEWLEKSNRKYPFYIHGEKNNKHFWKIAQKVRKKGFHFNS